MRINNVSFGNVQIVSGKKEKIEKLNELMDQHPYPTYSSVVDVTDIYKNYPRSGALGNAAQSNETVELVITDKDAYNIEKNIPGWTTTKELLKKVTRYHNAGDYDDNDNGVAALKDDIADYISYFW